MLGVCSLKGFPLNTIDNGPVICLVQHQLEHRWNPRPHWIPFPYTSPIKVSLVVILKDKAKVNDCDAQS